MIKKSKKINILILLIMLATLTGCWDYHEMVDFADVTSIAIDAGEEKRYKITLEGKKFSPAIDIDVEPALFESEGDTILEATRTAIKSAGKRIYLGSVKTIIINEEFAKEGIAPILDVFYRLNRTRLLVKIFIARGIEASSLLDDTAIYSFFAGYEISEVAEQISGNYGYSLENELYKTIDRLYDDYKDPLLFALELVEQPGDKKTFSASGIACFKGDKLIGYIEDRLINAFATIVNRHADGIASIPFEDKGYIGINIYKLKTKRKFKMIDGKINLYLDIKMEIGYSENNTEIALKEEIDSDLLISLVDDYFINIINELHKFAKEELKHDVLEIEEFFRKYNFKEWKQNGEDFDYLNNTIIHVNNKIVVRGSGHVRIK